MGIQHSSFYLWVGHCNSFHSSLMTWIPWRKDKGSANGFYPQKKFYIDDLCHMQRTHTFTEKETDVMGNDGYPSQNNVLLHSDTMKTLVICLYLCFNYYFFKLASVYVLITVTNYFVEWGEEDFLFELLWFFIFLRSGVLKEYLSGGQRSTQRRNRTCSDSSVYDTERKIRQFRRNIVLFNPPHFFDSLSY